MNRRDVPCHDAKCTARARFVVAACEQHDPRAELRAALASSRAQVCELDKLVVEGTAQIGALLAALAKIQRVALEHEGTPTDMRERLLEIAYRAKNAQNAGVK